MGGQRDWRCWRAAGASTKDERQIAWFCVVQIKWTFQAYRVIIAEGAWRNNSIIWLYLMKRKHLWIWEHSSSKKDSRTLVTSTPFRNHQKGKVTPYVVRFTERNRWNFPFVCNLMWLCAKCRYQKDAKQLRSRSNWVRLQHSWVCCYLWNFNLLPVRISRHVPRCAKILVDPLRSKGRF